MLRELSSYEEVAKDPIEQGVVDLRGDAAVAIDTERSSVEDV